MKKWLLVSLMVVSQLGYATEQIHFATEATYPPFEYTNDKGELLGFDIELAQALCNNLKAQCVFSTQSFNSLLPSLQIGKFDALIAAIGITPAREKQVAFTQSYYEPSASFIAAASAHYTIPSLESKTIGVQAGSTFEKYVKDYFHGKVNIKTYASIQDAFLDLSSARLEAVLADSPIAQAWLKQDDNSKSYSVLDLPLIDHTYFGSGYGIAVRKDNTELLLKLNKALTAIKKNGTYNTIVKKYFGTYLLIRGKSLA